MTFKQGQSGNPKGRPKKDRALTSILERAGGIMVEMMDGERISGRRLMARQVWEGITSGAVSFPDGKKLQLSPQDWKDFVKWAYGHIDGPPVQAVDITSGGDKVQSIGVIPVDYRAGLESLIPPSGENDRIAITDTATGSVQDSNSPGQDQDPGDGPPVG